MKVNIITLGCSKNRVDSEVIMAQLNANNIQVVHDDPESDSDVVVVNTCGFIENAKKESIDTILRLAAEKKAGRIGKLVVTGCLSERYGTDLKREIPEADAFFGTHDLPALLDFFQARYRHELIGERIASTPKHYAYLKISEGCNRGCSFCAIPLMRGQHQSKTMEELVSETKNLTKNGTKEIILIAQDLSSYGLDIYKEKMLPDLLSRLSDVDGVDWIRLHYAYPAQFPMKALDVMRERENICNYLDIPLQHISDRMLTAMRRGITKQRTNDLIDSIRDKVPEIAIRTTLLAGFPTETEDDFNELLEFTKEKMIDRLGVFTYSHEEDTSAFSLPDDVPPVIKEERAAALMKLQQDISYKLNQKKVGHSYKVLFDRKEGDFFIGRTEHDSPEVDQEVLIPAKENYVRVGDFSMVEITGADSFELTGTVKKLEVSG